jgi:hypothetical protein
LEAARRVKLPAMSIRAATRARKTVLRTRFIFEKSFRLEAVQATWLAHVGDVLSGGEQEARRDSLGSTPREIARMMKEKGGEVKKESEPEGRGERS